MIHQTVIDFIARRTITGVSRLTNTSALQNTIVPWQCRSTVTSPLQKTEPELYPSWPIKKGNHGARLLILRHQQLIRERGQRSRRRQRWQEKSNGCKNEKKLCTCITHFCTFLLSFFILNYATVFQNSTPENFGDIWKNGKDGMSAIMVLHFFVSLFKWRLRSRRRRFCLGSLFSRTVRLNWTFKLSVLLQNNNNKKQLDQAPFQFVLRQGKRNRVK